MVIGALVEKNRPARLPSAGGPKSVDCPVILTPRDDSCLKRVSLGGTSSGVMTSADPTSAAMLRAKPAIVAIFAGVAWSGANAGSCEGWHCDCEHDRKSEEELLHVVIREESSKRCKNVLARHQTGLRSNLAVVVIASCSIGAAGYPMVTHSWRYCCKKG
jgi:hypothetical protein